MKGAAIRALGPLVPGHGDHGSFTLSGERVPENADVSARLRWAPRTCLRKQRRQDRRSGRVAVLHDSSTAQLHVWAVEESVGVYAFVTSRSAA